MAENCFDLLTGVNPNCIALKKPGGISRRVWAGRLDDLDVVVFGGDGVNRVLSLTFKAGKGLVQYIGKRDKNSATMALEVSENRSLRNHSIILVLYYNTPEELGSIEQLIDSEGMFFVVETKAGALEVYGLNKSQNFADFGVKASSLEGGTGVLLTDSSAKTLTLAGLHENMELYYQGADTSVAITGLTSANPAVITMASTAAFEVGDSVTFNSLNGNQQIGGQSINGQSAVVLSKTGTTLTVNANVTGVTPATSGNISKVKDLSENVADLNTATIWPNPPI
jgi:hypothetical protein